MRVQQTHSAVQWLTIVQERRIQSKDKMADASIEAMAPEKEFLLVHNQNIYTNSENINAKDNTQPEVALWFGNQYLVKLDLRDRPNPGMKFCFHPGEAHTRPPNHLYPASYGARAWIVMPRHCLDDY
jgi:hypothetical protein